MLWQPKKTCIWAKYSLGASVYNLCFKTYSLEITKNPHSLGLKKHNTKTNIQTNKHPTKASIMEISKHGKVKQHNKPICSHYPVQTINSSVVLFHHTPTHFPPFPRIFSKQTLDTTVSSITCFYWHVPLIKDQDSKIYNHNFIFALTKNYQ